MMPAGRVPLGGPVVWGAVMDEAVKRRLLAWARQVITAHLTKESQVCVDEQAWPELSYAGAFVTLRHGEVLRGCIGTFQPVGSLPSTIREMAISACQDPRFIHNPIVPEELPLLAASAPRASSGCWRCLGPAALP